MSVKLFFQTHGRFPTTDEFRLIRTFRQHQPEILGDSTTTQQSRIFHFVRAARHGNIKEVKELLPTIIIDATPTTIHPCAASETITKQSCTALCAAAQGDHIDVLALLLDNGAAVDCRPSQNRTALLFASESGHFNSMNYLISRGATYFTFSDQQIESYFISYTIRQSITRRELSYVLDGDFLPGIVLDYLSLGGHRTRPIERLAPVNIHNKTSFGAKPIPEIIISPTPQRRDPNSPIKVIEFDPNISRIETYTPEEWNQICQNNEDEKNAVKNKAHAEKREFVESLYPQGFNDTQQQQGSTTTTISTEQQEQSQQEQPQSTPTEQPQEQQQDKQQDQHDQPQEKQNDEPTPE